MPGKQQAAGQSGKRGFQAFSGIFWPGARIRPARCAGQNLPARPMSLGAGHSVHPSPGSQPQPRRPMQGIDSMHELTPPPRRRACWPNNCRGPGTLPAMAKPTTFQEHPMSLFGAMNTAISGLNAQSSAFGNIGDNVANSQTVGFKRVDTSFEDYLTSSTASNNSSGAVVARPSYVNTVEGTVKQTDNALNLAISGQGFFSISRPVGDTSTGAPVFQTQGAFTREGDFSLNKGGYLVNASGDYLNGWTANSAGVLDQTTTAPIQIGESGYSPVPTSTADLAANLPASPDGSAIATQIPVIDSLGRSQTLNLSWTPTTGVSNSWNVSVSQGGSATPLGTATIAFGATGNPAAPEGTVGSVTSTSGALTGSTFAAGGVATVGVTANFGSGSQAITLNLGHFAQPDGLTQFSGTTYSLSSLTQNGVPPGSYNGVTMNPNGDVVVNYDNGQSRVLARVPVVTFADPNALQRDNGQAFLATHDSGAAQTKQAAANGAGSLVTSSLESSNVDIASEFTKLIVAQRAYTANTKMVTTADELLTATIDMKR
jgi:flagellar hook protein FlgE